MHYKISTRFFRGEGSDITSWQPLPARVGEGEWGGGRLANKKDRDDGRTRLLARMKRKIRRARNRRLMQDSGYKSGFAAS